MRTQMLSRRSFIKVAGLVLGAGTLTCSGAGYIATRAPRPETRDFGFGKERSMNTRVLVTYATRAGSTVEVAAAIGESLAQRGLAVDVKPVRDRPSLDGYQVVIMGSAIRMGKWLPEAVQFIKANQEALSSIPVGLFTVHMLNVGDDEASRGARLSYLSSIRPLLNGAEEVYFEGKMDLSRLSFLDRSMAKMVKSVDADRRDWDKIRTWIPAALA